MEAAGRRSRLAVGLVAISIALVALDGAVYLGVMFWERDWPAWWFVAGLMVAIAFGLGTLRRAGLASVGMAIAGAVILLVYGVLGILSIGLPLLVAGILLLIVAVMRARTGSAPTPATR